MTRVIFHADLDAFYASVEQLDHPDLRGQPVLVGRAPEQRGVVAAASYEARRFGIRSAMPMSRALRRCPEAVRLDPRFERYAEMSRRVMQVYEFVTPLIEPLSLDEAYLEVTERVRDFEEAAVLARHVKARVRDATGLTVSIGVATSKSVAKIASDRGKPDGLVIVPPGQEASFLSPLPVRLLAGVGPKTAAALAHSGIRTIGELATADPANLAAVFGSRAVYFQRLAQGGDDRPLQPAHQRKSAGVERTFPRDLPDGPELRAGLRDLAAELAKRLQQSDSRVRTIVLKLRYANFRTITRQHALAVPTNDPTGLAEAALALLEENAHPGDRFRLLGLRCDRLVPAAAKEE